MAQPSKSLPSSVSKSKDDSERALCGSARLKTATRQIHLYLYHWKVVHSPVSLTQVDVEEIDRLKREQTLRFVKCVLGTATLENDSFDQIELPVRESGKMSDDGIQSENGGRYQHLLTQHWVFRDRYGKESDSLLLDPFGSFLAGASRFVDGPYDYRSPINIEKQSGLARVDRSMVPRARYLLEEHWRPVIYGANGPDRHIHTFFINRQPTVTSYAQLLDDSVASTQQASSESARSTATSNRAGPRTAAPRFLHLFKSHWLPQSRAKYVEAAADTVMDLAAPPPKLTSKLLATTVATAAAPRTDAAPPCAEILHSRDRRASAAATPPAQECPPPPAGAAARLEARAEGASGTPGAAAPPPPPAGTPCAPLPRASVVCARSPHAAPRAPRRAGLALAPRD
jgi:hypothetical protein